MPNIDPLIWLLGVGAAIIITATLLRFTNASAHSKQRLRRSVILYVPYAILALLTIYLHYRSDSPWSHGVRIATDFLALLLVINLCALVLFDVGLRLVRLRMPEILHEVAVGVAYIVALVWLMHRSGVNLASIVATSAVATAVIGLSLQSTLGSVIGGLALQVDDSLSEGDWIELESKTQGQIKKVRWRHTVIETRDWDTLIVPNSVLLNQTIKILGKREGQPRLHRMWVYFNVDFRTAPSRVVEVVDDALRAATIPGVAKDPPPNTVCMDLARDHRDSFALYATRYWLTDFAQDDPTSSAVRQHVYTALKRARIPLAIPAAALFVSNEHAERTARKHETERALAREALLNVDIFRGLSDDELDELVDSIQVAPFAKGAIVTRQGARANWLYVLTQGHVEVRVAGEDGSTRRVNTLKAPSFFGEMALMTGSAREATVVALEDVQCLRVDREAFGKLLERRPELADEVAAILAERRVALDAAREHLNAADRNSRVEGERKRILTSVKEFFGLEN